MHLRTTGYILRCCLSIRAISRILIMASSLLILMEIPGAWAQTTVTLYDHGDLSTALGQNAAGAFNGDPGNVFGEWGARSAFIFTVPDAGIYTLKDATFFGISAYPRFDGAIIDGDISKMDGWDVQLWKQDAVTGLFPGATHPTFDILFPTPTNSDYTTGLGIGYDFDGDGLTVHQLVFGNIAARYGSDIQLEDSATYLISATGIITTGNSQAGDWLQLLSSKDLPGVTDYGASQVDFPDDSFRSLSSLQITPKIFAGSATATKIVSSAVPEPHPAALFLSGILAILLGQAIRRKCVPTKRRPYGKFSLTANCVTASVLSQEDHGSEKVG